MGQKLITSILLFLHFSSLGMMYAPQTVSPQYAPTAGMFAAAMLITGIFSGITFSTVFPYLIQISSWDSVAEFAVEKYRSLVG